MPLDAEEARARLDAVANPDWLAEARGRAAKLPRALRGTAAALLEEDPPFYGHAQSGDHAARLRAAYERLDSLSDRDRSAVMIALHPQIGPVLAQWWVDAQSQPYTWGWSRMAYRAPAHPEVSRDGRGRNLRVAVWALGPFDRDITWVAAWAPFLGFDPGRTLSSAFAIGAAGCLLASAIDLGGATGDAVHATLVETGNGEHPIGVMGRHVIVGMLRSHREEAWAYVLGMLRAAQRQEGLRQAILEAADESSPGAFDAVLATVLDDDLLRFAAAVRAAGVWVGLPSDVEHLDEARALLEQLRIMRADAGRRAEALTSGTAAEVYAGLCAAAMDDAFPALDMAQGALREREVEHRVAAVAFLSRTALSSARALLIDAIDDEHLAVAWTAHSAATSGWTTPLRADDDPLNDALYAALTRLLPRLPEVDTPITLSGAWTARIEPSRSALVATMFERRRGRPLSELVPLIPLMDPWTRERFASAAGAATPLTSDVREAVLAMVGDRSPRVRSEAVGALRSARIVPSEAPRIEKLLTRRAGDARRGALNLLATLPSRDALTSAARLWSGSAEQRDAACELLGLIDGDGAGAREMAARFCAEGATPHQLELMAKLLDNASHDRSADDPGLGLFDPACRTSSRQPARPRRKAAFSSDVARRVVGALDDLVEAHRDTRFLLTTWQGSREVLLADAQLLPSPFGPQIGTTEDEGAGGMVLPEVFRPWWEDRAPELREDDLDALRAFGAFLVAQGGSTGPQLTRRENVGWWWDALDTLPGRGTLGEIRHANVVAHVLLWLVSETASDAMVDECLDAVETTCAQIPKSATDALMNVDERMWWQVEWRSLFSTHPWFVIATSLCNTRPALVTGERLARWYSILRWLDEPRPGARRHRVDPSVMFRAHDEGLATDHDVFDLLFEDQRWMGALATLTRHQRSALVDRHPGVVALADQLRDRIIDIELARGDVATHASRLALQLASIEGAHTAASLLARLGKTSLVRGHMWHNESREAVYSHLIQVSYPRADDNEETLREAARAAGLPEVRLLDLAMYAPQWASTVERALGWDGLADGVWWFHAHTKDERWAVGRELRETWAALSAERTVLTSDDLVAGAVDVSWFLDASERLGPDRWKKLDAVAKLASGGNGHRRAQLYSAAMRGEIDEAELAARITKKRHQDSVRALGLLPFPEDGDAHARMLARYGTLREFERGSAKFGAQRRASEQLAVRIGIENLARTGGFADPQRFVWAMEAAEAGELALGPVVRSVDDVVVTLSVDEEGAPQLGVTRAGTSLAAVPSAYKKQGEFADLQARKTALTRQGRRVRASLEAAMIRGDGFDPGDFLALESHPVVAPMLGLLVYVDDDGTILRRDEGALTSLDGALSEPARVRVAHAVDLLASGEWVQWQEWQFASERRQPFKQLFRELYVITEAERRASPVSGRYEGHQVQPRQALALLGSRGWLADRESGVVSKAFLPERLVARLTFLEGFLTPAEVELPTIEGVHFTKPHEHLAEPFDAVPPRVFSEAMRDIDLVVSVAHAGGVDPEASASTVEMRAALVREMSRVMRLDNVRFVDETHVVIEGVLGEYSVHLGSAIVHRRPGGAVCIIPVDSQRRGRLFLPFADDDPKTAEVVSKVLLLARDGQIKDPTILEQLR